MQTNSGIHNINLEWIYFNSIDSLDEKKEILSLCGGVYLWIAPLNTKRVLYIGTAKNFQKRFFDHLSNQTKGGYIEFFYEGYDDLIDYFSSEVYAEGRDLPYFKSKENLGGCFTFPVGCFDDGFSFKRIVPDREKMIRRWNFLSNLQFAVAPINLSFDSVTSEEISEQVESILQLKISKYYLDLIKKKTGKQISHLGVRGTKKNALLTGSILKQPTMNFEFTHTGDIALLPKEIVDITNFISSED